MSRLLLVLVVLLMGCPKDDSADTSGDTPAPLTNALLAADGDAALPEGLTAKAEGKGVALASGTVSPKALSDAGYSVIVELGSDEAVAKIAGVGALMSALQANPTAAAEVSGHLKLGAGAPAMPESSGMALAPPAGDVATFRGAVTALPALLAQDWVLAVELSQTVRKK